MSLLLDALKKAEKAKDDALRRTQGPDGANLDDTVLQVRTRNELPDISAPLEMHSEDIPGNAQQNSDNPVPDAFYTAPAPRPMQEAPEPAPRNDTAQGEAPRRSQAPRASDPSSDPQAPQRAAAKNVFEAKFREPNPKLPFYITMGFLGAFTLGTVVYFWYQLRPPPALVNTSGKPPPDERRVDAPPPPPAASKTAAPTAAVSTPAIPGLPDASPSAQSPSAVSNGSVGMGSTAQPAAVSSVAGEKRAAPPVAAPPKNVAEKPAPPRRQSPARVPRASADPSKLSVNRAKPEVNPKLEAGWQAYNQGNLTFARTSYQDVLREEPANRDALLGMAAIEVRANRHEQAEIYYQKLLAANPRDSHALAGMMALRTRMTDPVQAESRVKSLLANDPEAHVLYFTLGNEFAQQGRWPEAQQAYFKAFSADPENPDFAYNLAVSLDHVRQHKLALEYYRRAISLAQQRASNFDQTLARNRVQELAR